MRKLLAIVTVVAMVASVALAAPDPWRIKVSDLDPNAPVRYVTNLAGAIEAQVATVLPAAGWGTGGGRFEHWWSDHGSGGTIMYGVHSFTASTGAISWGTETTASVAGVGDWAAFGFNHTWDILKVGGVYRLYNNRCATWDGRDLWYSTAATPTSFSVPTQSTVYGSTDLATGWYAFSVYRNTAGVYLSHVKNSHATPNAAMSLTTSGVGETVWWDIDTSSALGMTIPTGDPLCGPEGGPDGYPRGMGDFGRLCDGNLMLMYNFDDYDLPFVGWTNQSAGIVVGTAGELYGGDHYVYLCDPDSDTTIPGVYNSPFSVPPIPGLSGPSQRTEPPGWGNNVYLPMALKPNVTDPATKFFVLYSAKYDTNSDGTPESDGFGRGFMSITRNKADLNYDGSVSWLDMSPFSTAYGSSSGGPNWNPDADLTGDGKVNWFDVSPFSVRYGSDCSYQ